MTTREEQEALRRATELELVRLKIETYALKKRVESITHVVTRALLVRALDESYAALDRAQQTINW